MVMGRRVGTTLGTSLDIKEVGPIVGTVDSAWLLGSALGLYVELVVGV